MRFNSTKKALALSVLSLVVCVSMLIGTTFAWFTDSVTSANNKIVAGNLKVDLEVYTEQANGDYKFVSVKDSKAAIFDYSLWEPGYVEAELLKVENEGSLALKWKAMFVSTTQLGILADVIDVYVMPGLSEDDFKALQREDLANWTKAGTVREFVDTIETSTYGTLEAEKSANLGLALKMREEAGNEYQNADLGTFDIRIVATQMTAEEDSFDNLYDEFADYDGEISTSATLVDALKKGGTYKLVADITLDEGDKAVIPAGTVVNLDLDNKTITGTKGRDADNNRIHVIVNNGILTIKDGTVKSAGNDGGSAIYNDAGATLTIENVTLYGAPQSDPVYEAGVSKPFPSYAVNNYGNAVVNGATVKSYHGAIATGGNGVTVINDADIDVGLGQSTGITSYAIYSFENAQVTVNGGKFAFTKQEVYVNGGNTFCELGTNPIIINGGNYIGTSFSTGAGREYVIKGGTFDADPTTWVAAGHKAVKNTDGKWTVEREYINVVPAGEDKDVNGAALADAITKTTEASFIKLPAGAYKMPSIGGSKDVTIVGTKDTVIDVTAGAYMDGSKVAFEGVTIKGSTGMANGNGSDYAAMYTPDVTYVNCTFDGPFRIGRDGATFINCTFTNLGNDYVWNMSNDTVFEGCTFNTDGKALLLYADGPSSDGIATVVVKNCKFNATKKAYAGAVSNLPCAAIEIHNYGCGFNLTTSGNTYDSNFSGEWRIKTYETGNALYTITVNGAKYATTALDGKTMTIDANKNATVNG